MRIVDRKTFLGMPAGTVFSKYRPCVFGDLHIKGSTVGTNDFQVQQIHDAIDCDGDFSDILFAATESGQSISMDFDSLGRDGLFEEGVLFAVWERTDVLRLIDRLNRALKDSDRANEVAEHKI